ncbi:MAG: hypothetical protein HYR85_01645 [Planctomycetes bacterium]|nr:hypothetical protein [Planctomycetota bacterium]MBI3845970.1 hypothetical protein [Planctomycetota bacterium]
MARIQGVTDKQASLVTRFLFGLVRRKVGRMIEPIRIAAHQPKLLRGYGMMEMAQEKMKSVDANLKALCQIKVAMQIGCPF